MKAESLLASAGINIGLALLIFTLFSVLKKQPFTAPIYFYRRIAAGEELPIDRHFSLRRLCPSVSWIPLAFRLSEEDVIRQRGLDAFVVLRLFKLGINFFTVCSLLGLLILAPVNYASQRYSTSNIISHSMDSFTISNVPKGSNRLWVHFSCLCFLTFYALSMLYKEYKGVLNKRIQCIGIQRHRPDYFTILVRGIPLCEEHNAHGCSVDHFFSKHYPSTYQAFEMIYEGKTIEELQKQAASIERKIVKSHQKPIKQLCRGFICNALCGIFKSHSVHPEFYEEKLKELCQRIRVQQCEVHLKAKSGFFITYILTDGLSGFSLELLQLGLILWHFIRSPFDGGTIKDHYLFGFPYYRVITVSLAILIGMVYAVIAPLLLPFIIIYFLVGYAVYVNQMQDVYKIIYDTHGQYWPYIHHYIIITIVLMQLTMIGLFGLKSKPGASVSTVALVLLTVLFNEYCKIRFLPSFQHRPIQRQFIPLILRLPRKWMIKNWRVRLKGIKLLLLSMLIVLLGCVRWLFKHQAPSSLWFQLNTLRSAPCSILGFFSRLLCLSKLATIYVCDSQQGLNSYANHSNV